MKDIKKCDDLGTVRKGAEDFGLAAGVVRLNVAVGGDDLEGVGAGAKDLGGDTFSNGCTVCVWPDASAASVVGGVVRGRLVRCCIMGW